MYKACVKRVYKAFGVPAQASFKKKTGHVTVKFSTDLRMVLYRWYYLDYIEDSGHLSAVASLKIRELQKPEALLKTNRILNKSYVNRLRII